MFVTLLTADTQVAFWSHRVISATNEDKTVRKYNCLDILNEVAHIYTDADVSVNVFFKYNETSGNGALFVRSYQVYPVDTYGLEIYVLGSGNMNCYPISLDDGVSARVYLNQYFVKLNANDSSRLYSGDTFNITNNYIQGSAQYGILLYFTKPGSLFCFSDSTPYIVHQLLPVRSWSDEYSIRSELTDLTQGTTILISASVDNVQVNISGNNSEQTIKLSRGETEKVNASLGLSYNVKANAPIAVATGCIETNRAKFFNIIPPISAYVPDGVFTSIPGSSHQQMPISKILSVLVEVEEDEIRSSTTNVSINTQEDFYITWNQTANKGYGFSVVYHNPSDFYIIDGYTSSVSFNKVCAQNDVNLF